MESNQMTYFKRIIYTSLLVTLCACHQHDDAAHDHAHEHEEKKPSMADMKNKDKVDIPKNVRENLGIDFVRVEKRQLNKVLRVPGQFELLPEAYRNYHTNLPGSVELKVNLLEQVKVGQLLYVLNSPAWLELKQELIKVSNDIKNLEASLRLSGSKGGQRGASVRQFQQLLLEKAALYTGLSIKQLKQKVTVDGREMPRWYGIKKLEIRALSSGIVRESKVTNGEWVDLGARILSVVDATKLRFKASALQTDLAHIKSGGEAFISPAEISAGTQERVNATIMSGVFGNEGQKSFQVYASSETLPSWAKPGVSGHLEVILDKTSRPKLAIPKSVIVRDGLVDVFFRRDPKNPNKAIRIEADLGVDDGQWVEVISGVRKGDEIVLNGVYELNIAYSSSDKGAKKGGHFHADGTWHDEDH
jgi:hypothetical protein